jgi:predicted nucleic acid-binding protein
VTTGTLVDSNVLLDILTEDQTWLGWSLDALATAAESGPLFINPVIYAEVSVRFTRIEDVDAALPPQDYRRLDLPWAAAFLAGKAFLTYRRNGGTRTSTLPDFFIGAHAATQGLGLLTRDDARYRTYFPTVTLTAPTAEQKTGGREVQRQPV